MSAAIARIYDEIGSHKGKRVLVDRLWPRGISKERAALDLWLKEVAPSGALRTWYGHVPERFAEFGRRYRKELQGEPAKGAFDQLSALNSAGAVVLITATRDLERSGAAVLADLLRGGRG